MNNQVARKMMVSERSEWCYHTIEKYDHVSNKSRGFGTLHHTLYGPDITSGYPKHIIPFDNTHRDLGLEAVLMINIYFNIETFRKARS